MSTLQSSSSNILVPSGTHDVVIRGADAPPVGNIFSIVDDYSSQSIGGIPEGWSSSESEIQLDPEGSGKKVIKHSISKGTSKGDAGVGSWGGNHTFPNKLYKGATLYVSISMWFPSAFGLNQANPDMKFIRCHTKKGNGDNGGHLDWYLRNPGQTDPYFFIYEGGNSLGQAKLKFGAGELLRAGWHRYEYEIVLDNVKSDAGGGGHVKAWVDKQKILDAPYITFRESDYYCDRNLILSYWNNSKSVPENSGPDTDQFCYSDDFIITGSN